MTGESGSGSSTAGAPRPPDGGEGALRVLWLTNDLPPRAGGIEQFVGSLLTRVAPETTVVVGPAHPRAVRHDPVVPYRVVRAPRAILPTPGVLRLLRRVAARHRPDVVVLGASWPLGELAGALRRDPGVPVVALSHGLEAGLCRVGQGWLIRRATRHLAALTTVSDWAGRRLSGHVRAERVVRLSPGVDVERFRPDVDGVAMRRRWGVPRGAPLVGCVSRLVPRKGQDRLLEIWPRLASRHPGAWLVLVGTGPLEERLRRRAAGMERVVVAGEVEWDVLPAVHASLDVFAMPCRTRWWGLDVEGLGIVYLEAQASGVPVVTGRSGGAPETVVDGETGIVVDGRSPGAVADALHRLLSDPDLRARQGAAGRRHIEDRWAWAHAAERFRGLLEDVVRRGGSGRSVGTGSPRVDGACHSVRPTPPRRSHPVGASATSPVVPGAGAWSAEGDGSRAGVGVVVVHGITGNPHSTRPLGEALNDAGFTVEVPRLPGHGTSVADMAGTRYGDWYGSLRATVDDLAGRTDEVVLVGQSMGATLCLDLAGRHPDEVAGVVSINGQILDPDQPLAKVSGLLQYLVPRLPRDLAGLPSRDIARPDADEHAYTWVPARPVHSLLQALPEVRRRLHQVTAPLLVVYSLQDHTVPPRNSKALPELVGSDDVSVVPLERSYHVAILDWDAPLVAQETVAFTARVSGT